MLTPSRRTAVSGRCRIVVTPANIVPQPRWLRALLSEPIEAERLYVDGTSVVLVETARPDAVIAAAAASESAPALIGALSRVFAKGPEPLTLDGRVALSSAGDVRTAEAWLLRSLIKQNEGFMSRHFERRISLAITRRLATTSVTPNAMTLVSVAVGLVAAPFFLGSSALLQLTGALLFLAHSILDGCDGELARLKFLASRRGAILDFWGDNVVHVAVFSCIAIGWTLSAGTLWPLAFGAVAVAATLASAARAVASVAGGAAVGIAAALVWAYARRGAVPVALALFVPAALVLSDLLPRGLAPGLPAHWQRRTERTLAALAVVLWPLVILQRALGALLVGAGPGGPLVMLRQLGAWLAVRPQRGALDVSEAGLVARIARFAAKTVRDALVPHVDVCAVPDTARVGDVVALVRERGFSRLPVFHERLFNTIGTVSSFDLLGVDPALPVTAVMHEPFFVPETKPLPELLATLQAERRHLALVVDEYGGFVGLVTVEDLVEEIVGEIEDEYDVRRELYRRVAPGVFVVSARAPVADLNERFGWNLPVGDYETVGGLLLDRLGRVPKPGDGVRAGRVRLEVTRASARAVLELRVAVG